MNRNYEKFYKYNLIACILNLLIWHISCRHEYELDMQRVGTSAIIVFLFYLLCILLIFILHEIDSSDDTPILERYIRNYKIGLGYITFGSLVAFLVFSMFEFDSLSSSLFFYMCSSAPTICLNMMISSALKHSDLDSTRITRVARNMKTASVASILFTLMLVCFKIPNILANKSTYLLQQFAWVLSNCSYYIEFYEVMTQPVNLILVRNEDESEAESDDEQLSNLPTNILLSPEDLQCNVCFLQYSDKRVPLVLTKCGHSLCKNCCKATQRLSCFIKCPFCRTKTPGPISKLPKNYAIMGIVQTVRQVE